MIKLGGLPNYSTPLIIFHWDADGIASAALLKEFMYPDARLYTPNIGFYILRPRDIPYYGDVDAVFIVDYGIPTEMIVDAVSGRYGDVDIHIIDHHHRSPSDKAVIYPYHDDHSIYPSTTIMVSRILDLQPNLLTVLGYVGDLFDRVFRDRYMWMVNHVEKVYGLGYQFIKRLVDLIHTDYIFFDRDGVVSSVEILREGYTSPYRLFNVDRWRIRYFKYMEEVSRWLEMEPRELGKAVFMEVDTKLYISSYIGRMMASRYIGRYVILGFPRLGNGYSYIYVRIDGDPDIDFREAISKLQSMGYMAGGKDRVIGVFVDRSRYGECLSHIMNMLGVGHGV